MFDPIHSPSVEFNTFVDVLSQVFHDEPWEAIEAYAERAWDRCGFAEETSWEEVKSHVHREWNDRFNLALQESRRLRLELETKMDDAKRHSSRLSSTLSDLKKLRRQS